MKTSNTKKFSREQIENRVKSMIAEITGYDEGLLTKETRLTPDEYSDKVETDSSMLAGDLPSYDEGVNFNKKRVLSIGSLELAELLIAIDEEFQVNIPDSVANTLNTINRVVAYIVQHIQTV